MKLPNLTRLIKVRAASDDADGTDESRTRRRRRERDGRQAEAAAALWLQMKGYSILDRRVRTPVGEIDIVAGRGRLIAFVEVKARRRRIDALEAVTPAAQRRIEAGARMWAHRRAIGDDRDWRFDLVWVAPGRLPVHIRDAWRPPAS